MSSDLLKVPKRLKKLALWIHPEGRVLGAIFLHAQSPEHAGEEEPVEVLNHEAAFLAVIRENPDELRFYNKSSIVRVQYEEADEEPSLPCMRPLPCRIEMMDGSLITGVVKQALPPDRPRLLDYLNQTNARFIKISVDDDTVYLINKSYIIHATDLTGSVAMESPDSNQ
jgi:hypothetical protein